MLQKKISVSYTHLDVYKRQYLGYGMMLRLPVGFLPTYQIRIVVSMKTFFQPIAILVGCIWSGILVLLSWIKFCKCDFK